MKQDKGIIYQNAKLMNSNKMQIVLREKCDNLIKVLPLMQIHQRDQSNREASVQTKVLIFTVPHSLSPDRQHVLISYP